MLLYRVGDCVMHLCPICNRRTINVLDDDDDDDDESNLAIGGITAVRTGSSDPQISLWARV